MSKTVTVKRGEKLPENMVKPYVEVPVNERYIATLKSGSVYPANAVNKSIEVEVHDDPPPQAYLVVPCEKGKGTHRKDSNGYLYCGALRPLSCDHKQIPCALTLEDLQNMRYWGHVNGEHSDTFYKLSAIIDAWSAVPQAKEAGQ